MFLTSIGPFCGSLCVARSKSHQLWIPSKLWGKQLLPLRQEADQKVSPFNQTLGPNEFNLWEPWWFFCAVLWGEYPKPEGLRKTIIKESTREWGYIKVGFFYFWEEDFSWWFFPGWNSYDEPSPRTPQVKPAAAPAPVSPVLQPLNAQLLQQLLAAQAQAQAHELWVLTFWGKKHLQKLWGCFLLALEVW